MQEIRKIDEDEEKALLTRDLQERKETLKARLSITLQDEEMLWKTHAKQ